MTIQGWAKDFKSYVNALGMQRDDYNGIMEYIDDALVLMKTKNKTGVWKGWTTAYYKGRDDDDEPIWGRCTYYICSNCKRRTVIADPFCPSCGASMEKEM